MTKFAATTLIPQLNTSAATTLIPQLNVTAATTPTTSHSIAATKLNPSGIFRTFDTTGETPSI